jgi:hypothetical protein
MSDNAIILVQWVGFVSLIAGSILCVAIIVRVIRRRARRDLDDLELLRKLHGRQVAGRDPARANEVRLRTANRSVRQLKVAEIAGTDARSTVEGGVAGLTIRDLVLTVALTLRGGGFFHVSTQAVDGV